MREYSFRVYITDAARIACENTAKIGGGSTINQRWADLLGLGSQNSRSLARDTRTPEEIIADIAEKAGLTIV